MNTALPVIVFDVNETLSDMAPLGARFSDVGAQASLSKLWFATLLRDGFALASSGDNGSFAEIGADALKQLLDGMELNRDLEAAVQYIMSGMANLALHTDVPDGITALAAAGHRLLTLSNGSAQIAQKLLASAGIGEHFDMLLTVEDAPAWKPARAAYDYAASASGSEAADMMLVAVHPWDIHGAARAGLRTVWLNRTGTIFPGHFINPEITVGSLTELPQALSPAQGTA